MLHVATILCYIRIQNLLNHKSSLLMHTEYVHITAYVRMLYYIHTFILVTDTHIYSIILLPVGVVVELDIVTELDIVVVVVITVNMGTGDPIIRVVTETLFTTDPQIFPAVIFT